ncbi:uncharacterized protein BP5553_09823 [Venustampulla echinocandica]|uniref:Aflatoxin regulatory protein domain-containing protein n=1 Tax=Venustampulla echinocandica TaxID=2656787 RepID=A0A370TAS2_9HELO|nr:uncharacterized protein BP5553_09823 [Venustampulla echinocandica]RDL31034.1 hypothetical protein BP5553_09823 [Venustampulla echinocandica]
MNQEFSDYFNLSPMSLPDIPADLDLGLESSSLQANIDPSLTAGYVHTGADLGAHNRHTSQQQNTPAESRPRTADQPEQAHRSEPLNGEASEGLNEFTSFSPTMLPYYPPNYSRHRISLARNMSPPQDANQQGQYETMMDFIQQDGNANTTDGTDTRTDHGYSHGISSSSLLQSIGGNTQSSSSGTLSGLGQLDQHQEETSNPNAEIHPPAVTSWIRRLSDMNMQLHQHMVSIPLVGTGQGGQGTNSGNSPNSTEADKRLPVDHTFKLSYQYMELLNSIFSQLKSRRCGNASQKAADLTLDQPSQLLVLSSYLCLVESYGVILQHIKAWTEVPLKMGTGSGASALDDKGNGLDFPIKLPSLVVGSFELPDFSSTRPLVLVCIVETTMMHMHALVSDGMKLASNTDYGSLTETANSSPRAEKRMIGVGGSSDGLSSVAKVTLQAIEAHEDSTLQLIHVVWKMALRCAML